MDPWTPELWLRVVAFIVWLFAAYMVHRSKAHVYIRIAAWTAVVWRAYVLYVGLEPGTFSVELDQLIVHSFQPAVYIMVAIALVLAVRAQTGGSSG